jgi:hypothetical protein
VGDVEAAAGGIQGLDPVVSTSYNARDCACMVWDTIFAPDAAFRPEQQIAHRPPLHGVISSPIPFFWNIEKQQA